MSSRSRNKKRHYALSVHNAIISSNTFFVKDGDFYTRVIDYKFVDYIEENF